MLPYLLETCKWGAITPKMYKMSGSMSQTWICGKTTSQRQLNMEKHPKLGTSNPFSHGITYTKHLEPYAKSINQGLYGNYVPT